MVRARIPSRPRPICALAFLGITATEFIARSAYRPAYLAHAALSLVPLALRLLCEGEPYATLSSVLVLFFGGVLYSYCDRFTQLLDESIHLRCENAGLVVSLSREKKEAEQARDVAEASDACQIRLHRQYQP